MPKPSPFRRVLVPLLLAAGVVACFWRVASFEAFFQWDALDHYYPASVFQSDVFRSGSLPLWDPYLNCGTPVFSDPQSHLWYPPQLLATFAFGFSLRAFQLYILAHVVWATLGLYALARRYGFAPAAAACGALSFGLGGYFLTMPALSNFLVAASWLPWIVYGVERLRDGAARDAFLALAFSTYCLITGGNPAIVVSMTAFVLMYIALAAIRFAPRVGWDPRFAARAVVPIAIGFVLAGVFLVPFAADLAAYTNRVGAIPVDVADANRLEPLFLLTALTPYFSYFATISGQSASLSVVLTCCYLGAIALAAALAGAMGATTRTRWWPLGPLGLVWLFFAMGDMGFVHGLAWRLAPLFDRFRHPGHARLYVCFAAALLAAAALDRLLADPAGRASTRLRRALGFVLALEIGLVAVAVVAAAWADPGVKTFWERLASAAAVRAVVLVAAALLVYRMARSERRTLYAVALACLVYLDMASAADSVHTLTARSIGNVQQIYAVEADRPRAIEMPQSLARLDTFDSHAYNGGAITKQFQTYSYNPFTAQSLIALKDTAFREVLSSGTRWFAVRCPEVVRPDAVSPRLVAWKAGDPMPALVTAPPATPGFTGTDCEADPNADVGVIDYRANGFALKYRTNRPALLVSTESYHRGWTARIVHGSALEVACVNDGFLGVYVPAGEGAIEFDFWPRSLSAGLGVSAVGLVLLLGVGRFGYRAGSRTGARRPPASTP